MKSKNILYYLAIAVLLTSQLWAQNTNPVVSNVAFGITDTIVTVTYDVTDAQQSTVTISMEVSSNGGTTWDYNFNVPVAAAGNIGAGVAVGTGKTITWKYPGVQNSNFKIKIIADDLVGDQIYYAGKIYNTVTIGTQVWLKENLDVGTMISSTSAADSMRNNGIIEKYCYSNNAANCATYGGLYQWNEAMQYVITAGAKGICPTGWHIPTDGDLSTLSTAVGGDGNVLKAIGQGAGSGAGTDTSGFSALLAGYRYYSSGAFSTLSSTNYIWSSVELEADATYAINLYLNGSDSSVGINASNKEDGFSVRCLKD
jgi:uncharacterized protein (TIGR02145 family)